MSNTNVVIALWLVCLFLLFFYLYNGHFQDIYQQIKSHNDLINKNDDKNKVIFIDCTGQLSNIHQILLGHGIDRMFPSLFVFDSLMFSICEDKDKLDKLHSYVMKDCHHCNCSLIFVSQDLTYKAEKIEN